MLAVSGGSDGEDQGDAVAVSEVRRGGGEREVGDSEGGHLNGSKRAPR